jgi:hypothetical protein
VAAASSKLDKPAGGSLAEGLKAAELGFLAPGYDELIARLRQIAAAPPKGVKPEDVAKVQLLIDSRTAGTEQGTAAARDLEREAATRFREQHATWFE